MEPPRLEEKVPRLMPRRAYQPVAASPQNGMLSGGLASVHWTGIRRLLPNSLSSELYQGHVMPKDRLSGRSGHIRNARDIKQCENIPAIYNSKRARVGFGNGIAAS